MEIEYRKWKISCSLDPFGENKYYYNAIKIWENK
jgi:hypothetical protein